MRYVNASDGGTLMITGSNGLFIFGTLTNPIALVRTIWAGLKSNWTTEANFTGWTGTAGNGSWGNAGATSFASISTGLNPYILTPHGLTALSNSLVKGFRNHKLHAMCWHCETPAL